MHGAFAQIVTLIAHNFWLTGAPPLDEPVCGFTGSKCDYTPYIYGAIALVVILVVTVLFGLYRYYQFVHIFRSVDDNSN